MLVPHLPPHDVVRLVEWEYYPELRNGARRHPIPHVAERDEPRTKPLVVALAMLVGRGVVAAIAAWSARLLQARGH